MERSRTAAHNRLSGLRGTVARRRGSFASRDERATTSPPATRPHGVSVPMSIGRALAISNDPLDRLVLDERLSTSGEFEVEVVEDLAAGLDAVRQRHFDAIALDVSSAAGPNTATLGDLLDTAQESAIVVIGDSGDPAIGLKAIDAGAHEYVPRVQLATDAVLKAARRAVARNGRRVELDRLANTDALTGLLNRRGFDELGGRALEAAERLGSPFTLLLLGIDDLEQINYGFGHSHGDDTLRDTARVILACIRTTDIAARIGGDQFCVALTDRSPPPETVAARLGRKFDQRNEHRDGGLLSLTLGVSHSEDWSGPELWNIVDEANSRMIAARSTPA
jgi:diguanylate cyclase (GGDEF)-like protein